MCFKKIGIVLSGLLLVWGMSGCMSNSKEKDILSYLEDKYNESFVIENFNSGNKFVNQYGGDEAILHPEVDENLAFLAGTVDNQNGGYYDNYSLVKLADELKQDFEDIIKENIGIKYDYRVLLYSLPQYKNNDIMKMNVKEYIEYAKEGIEICLYLGIETDEEKNHEDYYEGLYNIFEKLKSYDTDYTMVVGFIDDINDKSVSEYLRRANAVEFLWEDIGSNAYGQIIATFLDDINSKEDLGKLYTKLGE